MASSLLWVKALHIVFVSSWFAGLFYLPRIFVNLASVPADSHAERERLLLMATRLYRFMLILMVPALLLGLALWLLYGVGKGPGNHWLDAKLTLVVVAIGYQHACRSLLRKFEAFANVRSERWYRVFNEMSVLVFAAIVILVVVKPFLMVMVARHRSSAVPLAWLYVGLIVYASLYPFNGWRVPGVGPFDFLGLGWPRWWTWFDLVSNLLGYLPFGFLLFVAQVRGGRRGRRAAAIAFAVGTVLSLTMETLQNYLPTRVSSNVDLGLNALGTGLGALVGLVLESRGGIDRWQRIRDRWFVDRSAGGLTLVLLWPIGLLFPTAVPFGLGHVFGRLHAVAAGLLAGTPAEVWASAPYRDATAIAPAGELAIVVLGLLAPCLVAFTFAVAGWRRAVLVVGAVALGALTTTLSTALNFGPTHALAWTTPQAVQAVAIATLVAALLSLVPRRVAAGFGLIALTALVMLIAQAPADPYFAESLQGWEQGRFIRFHGAAQWVGWLWPYAAITYLLARLAGAGRDPG